MSSTNNMLCSYSCKPAGRAVLLMVREISSVITEESFPLLSIRGSMSFQISVFTILILMNKPWEKHLNLKNSVQSLVFLLKAVGCRKCKFIILLLCKGTARSQKLFLNQVLLEQTHLHFTCCSWLFSCTTVTEMSSCNYIKKPYYLQR